MTQENTKYDNILWTMTKQTGGIPEFLATISNFLRRRTDFFCVSEKQWETLLLKIFHEQNKEIKDIEDIEDIKESDDKQLEKAIKSKTDVEIVSNKATQNKTTLCTTQTNEELSKPIEIAADETEADDVGKLMPNAGNGCTLQNYSWTQTLKEIELKIPLNVAQPVRSRDVNVNIAKKSLTVGIKGQMSIIDGELCEEIKPNESTWMLQDGKIISITLEKRKNINWWERLIMTDPVIAVRKILPESSRLSDLDAGSRITVEKMLYNQRQKKLGLSNLSQSSEDQEKMKILEKFKREHPELNFENCKY